MTIVAGDTVAALVAADALAQRGHPVTLYLPDRGVGGGFQPMRVGGWDLQLGLRLLEISYGPEEGPEPPLADYVPGMAGHRPYIGRVRRWFEDLLGDDLVELDRPEMFVNGHRAPDIYLTVDLSGLRSVLTEGQARRIAAETNLGWTTFGLGSDCGGFSLEIASLTDHGRTFHDLFIEPFVRKVVGNSGTVLASMRRKVWMPLFRPETLWEAASGRPVGFHPCRPFHGVRGAGIVERLLTRMEGRVRIVPTTYTSAGHILGYSPEALFAATGHPCHLDRVPLTLCWVAVAEDDVLNLPPTTMIPDPSVSAFRVNDGGPSHGERLICLEGTGLSHARTDLERIGAIREGAPIAPVHEVTVPAFAAPTAANRDRFNEAREATASALASAIVIGGAGAFGADSLNEQIVQGFWAAEQISG